MLINITGYVTETLRRGCFTIKITDDDVTDNKGKHPQVSEEVKIYIKQGYYPHKSIYIYIGQGDKNDLRLGDIEKCTSFSEGLKKGDRVDICVYIVHEKQENKETVYYIDNNPVNRENYTKFYLWLHPGSNMFKRLEIDTPQTLKFRKQNYYTDKNRKKFEKIVGSLSYKYNYKWWINKNPKILCPLFVGVRIKTKVSNILGKIVGEDKISDRSLTILGIAATIIVPFIFYLFAR